MPVSLSPSSGTGSAQTFQAVFTDPLGASDIQSVEITVNTGTPNFCAVNYNFSSQTVTLNNLSGGWIATPMSSPQILSNILCSANVPGVSVSGSGTTLTFSIPLTFQPAFAGAKTVMTNAVGSVPKTSGPVQEGTWIVPAVSVSISPSAAVVTSTSPPQQFTAAVAGASNAPVTWSISPSVGSISSTGLYTPPASVATEQTVTVTATSADNQTATATITLYQASLAIFQLSEVFSVAWPDQPIEFRYDGGQPAPGTARMIGPSGAEVPFQWVSSCSDATALKGCIVVRSSLPANVTYTWSLQSVAPQAAPPAHPVQIAQVGSNWEITNGLTGVRISTVAGNPSPWNHAPIQGIQLASGVWTGAGSSPNLLYSQSQSGAGNVGFPLGAPMFAATGYSVTVTDSGPMKTVVKATYTFNRPQYYYGSIIINTAGQGHYTIIVTLYANSKSVLIDEDTDMEFSYFLPLYTQVLPDQVRLRAHGNAGINPVCGYEAAVPVTGATNASPIVLTAAYALANGQRLQVSGVLGNSAANGTFYAMTSGYSNGQFALYQDAALSQPVAGSGAYSSGGIVKPAYRGQNLSPTEDGYQDITYSSDRPASYYCDTGAATYSKLISNYPPNVWAAPWYEEMYHSTDGSTGPLVGIFTGRSSQLVNSARGPSMPGIYSSNDHWVSKQQDSGIQVDALLMSPSQSFASTIHRNWGIFVSTKADLAPPSSHQPIGDDWDSFSGINLSHLYTYRLTYPDPTGGWQWLYLSSAAANQEIGWVRNGTPVCGSVNCYYNLLYDSDPSSRTILTMWQGNSSAAIQTALNPALALAQSICQTLVSGDNHFSSMYGYYQLGLFTQPQEQILNAILMDSNTTPLQKTQAKAALALFGSLFWDDDWFAIDNDTGEAYGLANQIEQYLQYRTQSAAAAPSQPYLESMIPTAITYPANDFNNYISSTGAAAGSTHYQGAFLDPLLLNYQNLSLAGVLSMTDPKWTAYANWELSIQTPPEPRFGNLRKGYSNGDGNTEADGRTGMLATALNPTSPAIAGNLMWAWRQANSPSLLTNDQQDSIALTVDQTIQPVTPRLGSINVPGYHTAERHGFGTPNETALWFINGGFYSEGGHRHADDGQVSIYAHAAPLAIDWNANLYSPETPGRFMHNSMVFDTELTHAWFTDSPSLSDANILFRNPTNTDFEAFSHSTSSTAAFTANDGTVWTRTVRTMAFDASYPVIYVTDSFAEVGAPFGKTMTWNLMASGPVSTPAGPITPVTRFSAGCQSPAGALPSTGSVYPLGSGLQMFSFTGQNWLQHATGGINWDLYLQSSSATAQFLIGNWGHGCHASRESGEYSAANGTPFAETQDILRVHDTGPFATIILPYRKTEAPARTVTQQACGVQILQGSETTCFNGSAATYMSGTTAVLATYDNSTQSAFGITVTGGPQEVVVQGGQITWTLSGSVAGTRSLTLSGNWSPNVSVAQSGSTYSYAFPGGAQTAPVTVVFTQQ